MKLTSCLIILFFCYLHVQAQQVEDNRLSLGTATTTSINPTTTTTASDNMTAAKQTPPPTGTSNFTSILSNNTAAPNSTMTGSISFYSPSPTSFVFTHFLPYPTAVSSSSRMSSARPSQSAPFPDDTIGKNGRLHISAATKIVYPLFYCSLLFLSIFAFS